MCSSTTQFQMILANSILVVRFAHWLGETEDLIDGYFCCTLVSGRLEDHFPPQIWCTPTTSPSILCQEIPDITSVLSPIFFNGTLNFFVSVPWYLVSPSATTVSSFWTFLLPPLVFLQRLKKGEKKNHLTLTPGLPRTFSI